MNQIPTNYFSVKNIVCHLDELPWTVGTLDGVKISVRALEGVNPAGSSSTTLTHNQAQQLALWLGVESETDDLQVEQLVGRKTSEGNVHLCFGDRIGVLDSRETSELFFWMAHAAAFARFNEAEAADARLSIVATASMMPTTNI